MTSIRRKLLVTLLAAIAGVTLAVAYLVYRSARQEIDTIFDYHLRQIALSLRNQASGLPTASPALDDATDFAIQLWTPYGQRVYLSRPDADLPEVGELGYSTVHARTGAWRVFAAELSGVFVEVAQPLQVRQRLAFAAALKTLAPVAFLLPLLALAVWRIVGRALDPLERLARTVARRTPSALDAIDEATAPDEVVPLIRSLNDLLGRLGAALTAQRAFVADAAHELRTPLAALKLQAELVGSAPDAAERARALSDLHAGLERVTHVVQQLLTLARAEPEAAPALPRDDVSLAELASQAVADHAVLAEARGIDLGATEIDERAVVQGDATALRTLLGNLVDNALRFTPRGGRVDVAVGIDADEPHLVIGDTGPGIPASDRERVFDRFYQRRGGASTGSGLGLAIVKAIADRHGASITLSDTPGGGLTVKVRFPEHAGCEREHAVEVAAAAPPHRDGLA